MSGSTPNLAIPYITASQNQKEATHSTGMALLDAAITEVLVVSVSAGNAAPSAAEYRACARIAITGATTAGRTVTLPVIKRPIFISLDAASTKAVSVVRGSASFTILPGMTLYAYTDGATNGLLRLGEFGPYYAAPWIRGTPGAGELLYRFRVREASTLLPDLLGWSAQADVAATASAVFDVRKNGVSVGSMTFAAAGTVATLATSGGTAQSFAANDFLDIVAPSPADATLADVTINLLIVRN
jgi:hypothetical protein